MIGSAGRFLRWTAAQMALACLRSGGGCAIRGPGAEKVTFDGGAWRTLNLPHEPRV
jgi:hypothetical protein